MALVLKKRGTSTARGGSTRVKVTTKSLLGLVSELAEKAKRGEVTIGEIRDQYDRAESEDGLFSKHWRQPLGKKNSAGGMVRTPQRWQDPGDAAGNRGGRDSAVTKQVTQELYEAIITSVPGEMPNLMEDEDLRMQKRLQDLHDGMVFCCNHIDGYNPYTSKYFREYSQLSGRLVGKILTTQSGGSGTGTGGEFIPQTLSGQLIELFRQRLVLAGSLDHVTMPDSPWKMPLEGADVDPYFVAEATDENVGSHSSDSTPTRTPATAKVTFTAKTFKVRGLVSEESQEDAIMSMVDYMRRKLVEAMAQGWEDALINSDSTSPHLDSDVTGATHHLKSIDGLRQLTNSAAKVDANGALTALKFVNLFTKMGKFGSGLPSEVLLITGPIGLAHLTADGNLITVDKVGARATLLTGQVGSILGRPLITSGHVREDLNASGVYDGSTTSKTMALAVHRPSFAIGDRRNITVESAKDITTGKFTVVVSARMDFQRMQAETTNNRNVAFLYNINTAASFS